MNSKFSSSERNHIKQVLLNFLLSDGKSSKLENFEENSDLVKKKSHVKETQIEAKSKLDPDTIQLVSQIKIFNKPTRLLTRNCLLEDIHSRIKLMEWSGYTFTKTEWFKISLHMKKLLNDNLQFLNFWGKIYGQEDDYFILQGKAKEAKSKIKYSNDEEPFGQEGRNNYIFWVANNSLAEWFELPMITAEQLRVSRLFKYIFKGRLNAKVNSFVPFDGTEAHLLKCQILRIMHSCFIAPNGYLELKPFENSEEEFGVDLSDKVTQVSEEFKVPQSNDELQNLEGWIHRYNYIYDNGRIIETNPDASKIEVMQSIANDKRIFALLSFVGEFAALEC